MKILFIGTNPFKGGGVAYYEQALTREFQKREEEVTILSVTTADFLARHPYLKKIEDSEFEVFDLVTNKNYYFSNPDPLADCRSLEEEKLFEVFLQQNKPDIIHFHAARPANMLFIAANAKVPTLVSLHDYWFICNAGFLCRRNNQICAGPSAGFNCAIYCEIRNSPYFKLEKFLKKLLPAKSIDILKYMRSKGLAYFNRHLIQQDYIDDLLKATCNGEKDLRHPSSVDVQRWSFRINFMRKMLNEQTNFIIAVSEEVKKIFAGNGIDPQKIKVLHSGFEYADDFFDSNKTSRETINFAYIGPIWREKGLHVVIKAFQKIGTIKKSRLYIYGRISLGNYGHIIKNLIRRMRISNIIFKGEFNYQDLPSIYKNIDIQIIPPIGPDPSPRTVWEALASKTPIIASNIGGIRDFVQDGVNGLLFEAGNPDDLAEKIMMIVDHPGLISVLRGGIKKLKTIKEHSCELINIYSQLLKR